MEELTAIIALSRVKGLDRVQKRQIIEKLDQVAPLFEGRPAFLNEETGRKISAFKAWKEIDNELAQLERMNVEALTIKDRAYPGSLRNIPDPPLVLYKKGTFPVGENTFAIVGSRRATTEGMHISEKIAETLSTLGVTVASGLARGIDAASHRGALKGKGKTIAVLGCGLDICYPAENKGLFDRIGEEGVILTEYGLGLRPLARNFPERNRIIAGLSKGILVVEAAERSGSLITARLGVEYGKDIMAIPGSIFDNGYKGANTLIKEGAKLIDSVEDIISECFPDLILNTEQPVDMNSDEDYIYSIIGMGKIHIDEVIEKSRMAAKEVLAILTMLEMKEAVQEIPGGFYIRK